MNQLLAHFPAETKKETCDKILLSVEVCGFSHLNFRKNSQNFTNIAMKIVQLDSTKPL
jgi:hypothetical protein